MRKKSLVMKQSRKRVWRQVSLTLAEMRLQNGVQSVTDDSAFPEEVKVSERKCMKLSGVGLKVLFAVAAGALAVLSMLLGRKSCEAEPLFIASSLHGMVTGRTYHPIPSSLALSEAGLSLSYCGELDLPGYSAEISGIETTQLLAGKRYGRTVRSGVLYSSDGRVLVRTGISSTPPGFSCRIRDGHLFSYNSTVKVDSMLLSGRIGPGTVTIVNDGLWLVLERLLIGCPDQDNGWLLLRQLRDISVAEILSSPEEFTHLSLNGQAVR